MLTVFRIGLAAALALTACRQDVRSEKAEQDVSGSLAKRARDAATAMGFVLPPSAVPEFAEYQAGLDDNARLTVIMSTADWAILKAKSPFNTIDPRRYSVDEIFHLGEDGGGWTPSRSSGLQAAQAPIKTGPHGPEALNVGVAPISGDRVRLYLFWYQIWRSTTAPSRPIAPPPAP